MNKQLLILNREIIARKYHQNELWINLYNNFMIAFGMLDGVFISKIIKEQENKKMLQDNEWLIYYKI